MDDNFIIGEDFTMDRVFTIEEDLTVGDDFTVEDAGDAGDAEDAEDEEDAEDAEDVNDDLAVEDNLAEDDMSKITHIETRFFRGNFRRIVAKEASENTSTQKQLHASPVSTLELEAVALEKSHYTPQVKHSQGSLDQLGM